MSPRCWLGPFATPRLAPWLPWLALLVASFARQDARPAPATLVGRFVLEGGTPARELSIELTGYPTRPKRDAPTEPWRSPSTRTGDDGRFALAFDAPDGYALALAVKAPGFVGASWRFGAARAGDVIDLGEFVLARGGTLSGRIVDREGRPVHDAWYVYADRVRPTAGGRGEPPRAQATLDPRTGRFLLDDLPEGPAHLQAYSRVGGWIDGPTVDVEPDSIVEADLTYEGPDNARRIVVQVQVQPYYALVNEVDAVYARSESDLDAVELRGKRDPRQSGVFGFDDLAPGTYTVEVRDPRFRAWKATNVELGTALDARLVGAGRIVLELADAETHARIDAFGLKTRIDDVDTRPNAFDLFPPGTRVPSDGLVAGLLGRPQTIVVQSKGYSDAEARVDELLADPPRVVKLELRRGVRVEGVLTEVDGTTPASFVEVHLVPHGDLGAMAWSPWNDADLRKTVSDAAGRFAFDGVAEGDVRVRAVRAITAIAQTELHVDASSPRTLAVRLALPRAAVLKGRVLAGDELDLAGCRLAVLPSSSASDVRNRWNALISMNEPPPGFELASDGSFRIAPIAPGTYACELLLPAGADAGNGIVMPPPRVPVGVVDVADAPETARDLDVRANGPGALRVALIVDGADAANVELVLVPRASPYASASLRTDASGVASTDLMLAGELGVTLVAPGNAWSWIPTERPTIVSGRVTQVTWELATARAPLVVADAATHAPIANARVVVQQELPPGAAQPANSGGTRARANARGEVDLRLVVGRYRLSCEAPAVGDARRTSFASAAFDWTSSGPEPATLELQPLAATK